MILTMKQQPNGPKLQGRAKVYAGTLFLRWSDAAQHDRFVRLVEDFPGKRRHS
uniref:Uncharacterized protein n=1 Tax=Candidatus Kentrum sp. DK TaxID=2126562 RepID=A0A450S8A6_9GAMM|nr:MAG: hypothetical protein BECKDK2373B_GA0170837_101962 [Candidatus Kentron sp. DK]